MLATLALVPLFAATVLSTPMLQDRATAANITTFAAATGGADSAGTANNKDLVASLLTAASATERLSLLSNDQDFVFDFASPPEGAAVHGKDGFVVRSSQTSFPALVGQNSAMTMGFLGPCGFNTPHTHPRGAELNLVIEGTIYAQMMTENNGRVVTNQLEKYQMTVFPQGAMHTEFNPTCENATFVASFPSSDPGTQQIAQTLFSLSGDLISAVFGEAIDGAEVANYYNVLPAPVAKGVTSCLAKCGIPMK